MPASVHTLRNSAPADSTNNTEKSGILSNWFYDSAAAARTKRTRRVRAEAGQELVADAALDAHALRMDLEDVCAPLLPAAQRDAKARS